MKRKYTYPLLVLLLTAAYLVFEDYIHRTLDAPVYDQGATVKATTNTYFLPTSTTGQIIHHDFYSLSYDEDHEQPEWVAYELKKSHLSRNEYKRPYFEVDPSVKTKAAHWRNYKNSGYDRGHLCPAGDRRFSKKAYEETFLTSNITPQKHNFNAGIWNSLEQQVRRWAAKYDGVFIVTGGVLNAKNNTIGTEKVTVPDAFYKIVYDRDGKNTKMIAFLIPHKDSDRPLQEFVTTVDEIEQRTGIDFFPELEDHIEQELEASKDYQDWSFR